MKNILPLLLTFMLFIQYGSAQQNRFNIVFDALQTELSDTQINEINFVASRLSLGEHVVFYPLVYDQYHEVYKFNSNAKRQAESIAEYAKTVGFELEGMPRNFPSSFSGLSFGVVMRYTKPAPPTVEASGPARGMMEHYPIKPSQFFLINPLRDTNLTGNEGTVLYLKAGCLLSKNTIEVELKEFYQLSDYIKNGLPTTSNGQMIETGGSMYLNAKEKESKKQVAINPDKGIGVDFTIGKNDTSMQVFIKDPRNPKGMNWILPPQRRVVETWQMTETVVDHNGKVLSEKKFNSKAEWDKHVKEEEAKALEEKKKAEARALEAKKLEEAKALEAKKREEERIKNMTQEEKNQVKMNGKLQVYNLGYINCDRFPDEPVQPLMVLADQKIKAEYYLVYTDVRGVMKGNLSGNQVSFGAVVVQRPAFLIAVSFIGDKAYYYKGTVTAGRLNSPVVMKPVDESFINAELASLN